jgi:hypothetical protein
MKIYLEGIERSGNVFLQYCLHESFFNQIVSTREHELNALKGYDKADPFVVPVRDALPSIVSSKIYRDYVFENNLYGNSTGADTDINFIISRYKEYMKYLLDNPRFFIAPFHEFTKDHNSLIYVLLKKYTGLNIKKYNTVEEIFETIHKNNKDVPMDHAELGNFLRRPSPKKEQVEEILLSNHKEEIKEIQHVIDLLYKRYDSYKVE